MLVEWLEEFIGLIEALEPDNTTVRIESNRRLIGEAYRKRNTIKTWTEENIPDSLNDVVELISLLDEYFNCFVKGYKAPHLIDVLPDLITAKLVYISENL
jgi:endonuclease III-like uncharacterized protein